MTRYYNSLTATLLALSLIAVIATDVAAQERVVTVEPGIGTLNEAINSDTTDTGDRIDPENTVYELQPGGYYGLQGSIENRFPLYVRTAATSGKVVAPEDRAQLVPAVGEGGASSRAFRARDDIRLEGLYVTGRDEAGGFTDRIVRVSADSARVILDNCHLDFDAQSGFRLDNDWVVLKMTNSVMSNIGRAASLNNGRGVDTRGNNVDTLIFHNTTFYNLTSRIVRDAGGFINYAELSRNTVYNVAQFGFSLGEVQEAHVTDNFIINAGFLGQNDSLHADRTIVGIDSLSPDREGEQTLNIGANFVYYDPMAVAALPDTVRPLMLVDPMSPAAADVEANFTVDTVSVEFVESLLLGRSGDIAAVPMIPTDLIEEYWAAVTAGLPEDDLPDMDNGDGGALPAATTLPFNFRYAETEPAATAAADGMPLGDRNWFDLAGVAVEEAADLPETHRLVGNYPNPFNPSTTIQFDLAENADVTVAVFDITGKQVMSVDAGALSAGSAEVQINALNAPSGTYIYRVSIEGGAETKILSGTMTLLK